MQLVSIDSDATMSRTTVDRLQNLITVGIISAPVVTSELLDGAIKPRQLRTGDQSIITNN